MPSVVRPSRSSPEAYRALERKADDTSEDVNGPIIAMAGASRPPHRLAGPLSRAVSQPWRGRPGAASRRDRRVTGSRTGLSTSPDGVVVCGESTAKAPAPRLPPLGMVAVLSAATAAADRVAPCAHDRRLASLHAALLVAQDKARLEHDVRQGGAPRGCAQRSALSRARCLWHRWAVTADCRRSTTSPVCDKRRGNPRRTRACRRPPRASACASLRLPAASDAQR